MAPSPLENLIAEAWGTMAQAAGTEVTYTPAGGSPKTIAAILAPASDQYGSREEVQQGILRREVTISRDATWGIAEPAIEDQVTIGGVVYAVEAIAELATATALLRLVSVEQRRVADPGLYAGRP